MDPSRLQRSLEEMSSTVATLDQEVSTLQAEIVPTCLVRHRLSGSHWMTSCIARIARRVFLIVLSPQGGRNRVTRPSL